MVDARLHDGSRVNAIIPPLSVDGPLVSIRKFAKIPIDMQKLVDLGSLPQDIASILQGVVRARRNVLISGGTGSGKTTTLYAALDELNTLRMRCACAQIASSAVRFVGGKHSTCFKL